MLNLDLQVNGAYVCKGSPFCCLASLQVMMEYLPVILHSARVQEAFEFDQ